MQLIDESGAKILLNGGDASDTNVFSIRGRCGSLEGEVDSIGHEMKVVPPCIGIDSRG